MKLTIIRCNIVCLLMLVGLVGCDSIPYVDKTEDYKGAGRSRPLEVPPDLTAGSVSDAYSIPGGTNFSTYSQAQEGQDAGVEKVLETPDGVRLVKEGTQRWLVVNAPAEKIWPVIREFWADQGFAVRTENAQTGVMETEWIETDALKKDNAKNIGEKFDRWLDGLLGDADKKKFRTRLERGAEANTTEIYMTHRTVSSAPDDGKNYVRTPYGKVETGYREDAKSITSVDAKDAELDTELLRRLMIKLGVDEKKSKAVVANAVVVNRAQIVKEADGSSALMLTDPFDRAWRRVGLALDRIGFVVEDKDRASGVFFVRYADADVDIDDKPQKKKGILESLKFWGSDDKKTIDPEKQYRVKISDGSQDNAVVTVLDKDGEHTKTAAANRIVTLMYEQLK